MKKKPYKDESYYTFIFLTLINFLFFLVTLFGSFYAFMIGHIHYSIILLSLAIISKISMVWHCNNVEDVKKLWYLEQIYKQVNKK